MPNSMYCNIILALFTTRTNDIDVEYQKVQFPKNIDLKISRHVKHTKQLLFWKQMILQGLFSIHAEIGLLTYPSGQKCHATLTCRKFFIISPHRMRVLEPNFHDFSVQFSCKYFLTKLASLTAIHLRNSSSPKITLYMFMDHRPKWSQT